MDISHSFPAQVKDRERTENDKQTGCFEDPRTVVVRAGAVLRARCGPEAVRVATALLEKRDGGPPDVHQVVVDGLLAIPGDGPPSVWARIVVSAAEPATLALVKRLARGSEKLKAAAVGLLDAALEPRRAAIGVALATLMDPRAPLADGFAARRLGPLVRAARGGSEDAAALVGTLSARNAAIAARALTDLLRPEADPRPVSLDAGESGFLGMFQTMGILGASSRVCFLPLERTIAPRRRLPVRRGAGPGVGRRGLPAGDDEDPGLQRPTLRARALARRAAIPPRGRPPRGLPRRRRHRPGRAQRRRRRPGPGPRR